MIRDALPQGEAAGDVPQWHGVNRISRVLQGGTAADIEQSARENLIERQNQVISPILVSVLTKMKAILTLDALRLKSIDDLVSLVRHFCWRQGIFITRENAPAIEEISRRLISQHLTIGAPRTDVLDSQNYIG